MINSALRGLLFLFNYATLAKPISYVGLGDPASYNHNNLLKIPRIPLNYYPGVLC